LVIYTKGKLVEAAGIETYYLNDKSIDPQSRAIIRYAREIHDPWLARLVRRADAGETIVDNLDFEETPETKIEIMRAF
jgi:hypothetical protein